MRRKIGAQEADEGYLLVEKAWLPRLPEPNKPFQLSVQGSTLKTRIEETGPCECRGAPHTHYRIPLPLMNPEEGRTATLRIVRGDKIALDYE